MARKLFILSLICLFSIHIEQSKAQGKDSFEEKFRRAKRHLAWGANRHEAITVLNQLVQNDPGNANLHYLIGVSMVLSNEKTEASINHLLTSTKDVTDIYDPESHLERQAPIYAYYYLVVAYSQNGRCKEARETMAVFLKHYGNKNDLYTNDAKNWVTACESENPIEEEVKKARNIVTKKMEYSTSSPLYGVQVGAFAKLIPVKEAFADLKNVEAFIDKDGIIRYVIGNFRLKSQAENLLERIKMHGYEDAFIVNVNAVGGRFSEEVVIVNNESFKAPIWGKVVFSVQIGAFRDVIPDDMAALYLQLDGIKESLQNDITVLSIGNYDNYEEAMDSRNKLISMGIPGAFVVAHNRGQKINLEKARLYMEAQKRESIYRERQKNISSQTE